MALAGLVGFIIGFTLGSLLMVGFKVIQPNPDNELMARLLSFLSRVETQRAIRSTRPKQLEEIDFTDVKPRSPMSGIYKEIPPIKSKKKGQV